MRISRSFCILLVATSFVVPLSIAAGDPPRKSKAASQPTSQPAKKKKKVTPKRPYKLPAIAPFKSRREMTAKQRREMDGRRYQIFQAKKRVQSAIRCKTCKGNGRSTGRRLTPLTRGSASDEDVRGLCPRCRGLCIFPSSGAHEALAEYYARSRSYEKDYPFAGYVDTGLEKWICGQVNTVIALQLLNQDAHRRLAEKRFRIGDVFLIGVYVFNVVKDKDCTLLQCELDPISPDQEGDNLIVEFYGKEQIQEDQHLFILALNLGDQSYTTTLGEKRTAQLMGCMGWKLIVIPDDDR